MYKIFKISALLFVAALLAACQKDLVLGGAPDEVPASTETLTLKQEGETKRVDFTALADGWSVEQGSHADWLTAKKAGALLEVTAAANPNADERRTTVTVLTPGGRQTVTVTQFGAEPYIAVEGNNGTVIYNHEAHAGVELNITSNSDDWRVEQVDKEKNNWLTYEVKQKERKLALSLTAIDRNSEWAQTSRTEKLFLSNGNKHYELNVTQNGYVQFQLPVWDLDNFNLDRLTALEAERNNSRARDVEINSLLPYKDEGEKTYYVFHSPGEQAPYLLYQPYYYTKLVTTAWLKAPAGKTFKQESFDPWLRQQNFKLGNKQRNENETEYYCEEEDKTRLIHVYNEVDNFYNYGGIFHSACMKYVESPNDIKLGSNYKATCFPVFASNRLHNKNFKLEEVIAFEKKRGMRPDFENQYNSEHITVPIQDPHCKYSRLLFVPESSNYMPGSLANVIYFFNWQGVTAEDIDAGLVNDVDLSGTVGSCQVFYVGNEILYNREVEGTPGVYEWYTYSLPSSTRRALTDKGYSLVREESGGFASFYRGDEDLIDMRPQETRTVITYYKSKHYVDIIKKRFNP
ncbi:BACON domain-containing protein [Segatella baroniae]|uniref:BACON domain-containing protein n=1 Tax=Segatella baroniae TaxID=305719 RepID=UPI00040920BC|nr:BACON domain-containing protein [Segatella baroniae]